MFRAGICGGKVEARRPVKEIIVITQAKDNGLLYSSSSKRGE